MIKEVKKVFVAMSGGVDSSVAALILKEQGYEVVGVFMRCFNLDGCAERDAEDARRVAEHLNIPFYVWDFEDEYKDKVVKYMIDGYRHGITPNPDVMCNKEIKFGLFMEKALAAGADYVATGHYVRKLLFARTAVKISPAEILRLHLPSRSPAVAGHQATTGSDSFSQKEVSFGLGIAKDTNKDQSYFLWTLTQKQLKQCLFPIGDYLKPQIRAIAKKAGLSTADKKDSQGICFLGKITLADFLKSYIPEKKGVVLNSHGEKIGEHSGAYFYTIGQRHIGVASGKRKAANNGDPKPLYVSEKKIGSNTLVVAEGSENPALYRKEVVLRDVNFINPDILSILNSKSSILVLARLRYRQSLAKAILLFSNSHELENSGRNVKLVFESAQKFVAPGQSAVFYSSRGETLGGGIII